MKTKAKVKSVGSKEVEELKVQLKDARDTLEAIRTGQIDALIVNADGNHSLYTLRSADHTYRLFIEKMMEGAVTLNANGVVLYANSRFHSMVEGNGPAVGRAFVDFLDVTSKVKFTEMLKYCWEGDCQDEITLVSGIIAKVSLTILEMDEGTSVSVILTDLSSQKAYQRELKYKNDQLALLNESLSVSNTDLQQFASVASHDLQEPLRKIQVFSSFIKGTSGNVLEPHSKRYLDKILLSAQRMKVLIQDILNYSRLSASLISAEPVPVASVVKEVLEDFELKVKERKAKVEVGDLPKIQANRGQLRQIFQNLLSNSLKFSKAETSPIISIKSTEFNPAEFGLPIDKDKYSRIIFSDNGIGFDQKYAKSIFNLFEMLNPKATYEGSGIGLAIAKKIIEKHKGHIVARSSENNGAEFNIFLPFRQEGLS